MPPNDESPVTPAFARSHALQCHRGGRRQDSAKNCSALRRTWASFFEIGLWLA